MGGRRDSSLSYFSAYWAFALIFIAPLVLAAIALLMPGISILRQRAHFSASLRRPIQEAAEAFAVKTFNLSEEQRKWLTILERD